MASTGQRQPQATDFDEPIISLPNGAGVRLYRHTDAPSISHHGNNHKIARNMLNRWPSPYTVDRAHEWIALARNPDSWVAKGPTDPKSNNTAGLGPKIPIRYAITKDDVAIGGMGIIFQGDAESRAAAIGYWIGEEFWRTGIMSAVLPAWVDWIWETFPWIIKLQPSVYAWNPASARLLEKCGFQHEGTLRCAIERFGKLTDLKYYGLIREGYVASLEPPEEE